MPSMLENRYRPYWRKIKHIEKSFQGASHLLGQNLGNENGPRMGQVFSELLLSKPNFLTYREIDVNTCHEQTPITGLWLPLSSVTWAHQYPPLFRGTARGDPKQELGTNWEGGKIIVTGNSRTLPASLDVIITFRNATKASCELTSVKVFKLPVWYILHSWTLVVAHPPTSPLSNWTVIRCFAHMPTCIGTVQTLWQHCNSGFLLSLNPVSVQ